MSMLSPLPNRDLDEFELNGSFNSNALSPDRPLRQDDLNHSRNSSAARRANQEEKQKLIKEAEDEYKELLKQLEDDENVTAQDIDNFKKNALIQKSVQEVRRRAMEQQQIRGSPERYRQVKSKVGQNFKTSTTVQSQKHHGEQSGLDLTQTVRSPGQTMQGSQYNTYKQVLKLPAVRERSFDITQEEYEQVKQNTHLSDLSQRKLTDREQQIRECEQYLNTLQQELNDKRPIHEKLQSFKDKKSQQQNDNHQQQQSNEQVQFEQKKIEQSSLNNKVAEQKSEQKQPETQVVKNKKPEKVGMRPGGNIGSKFEADKKQESDHAGTTTITVKKNGPAKVEMRPDGKHGSQLQQKNNEAQTFQVQKKAQEKVEMRPDGKHGSKLQQKNADAQSYQVQKKTQEKVQMRPGGKNANNFEMQKQQQQQQLDSEDDQNDKNVINVKDVQDGKRIDLNPPEGADGCVMFIESRQRSQSQERQGAQVVQVKQKKQGVNTQFPGAAVQQQQQTPQQPKQQDQQVVEEPKQQPQVQQQIQEEEIKQSYQEEEQSEGMVSEDIESEENFGGLAKKEAVNIESNNKFYNSDLAEKTQQIQDEFVKILEELNTRRKNRDGEAFYTALTDYYQEGSGTHSSPVRRLIQHKNTAFEHKKTMKDNIDKGDYAFVYTTGPQKSYVIEPHGGELNYKLAQKDPNKFYDQVFNQDITKHTVGQDKEVKKQIQEETQKRAAEGTQPLKKSQTKVPVTVKSKVTKRPHHKIMEKLRAKIAQKLQEKLHELGLGTIMTALKDKSVQEQIKELVKQDKIQILDQQNNVIFEQEIKEEIGIPPAKRKTSHQLSSAKKNNLLDDDEEASANLNMDEVVAADFAQDGIDTNAQTKTHLKIADRDLKKIETKVRDTVKRQSSFKN